MYLLFKKIGQKYEFVDKIKAENIDVARGIVQERYGEESSKMYLVNDVNLCKVN